MATLSDIKRRIASVKSTQQITNAMKMVAAAKLRRAQERLMNARPYGAGLQKIISHVAAQEDASIHPLLAVRDPKRVAYLVVTSDRGLCGSFNSNVTRQAKMEVDAHSAGTAELINFGRKGVEFFSHRGYELSDSYVNLFNDLEFGHAQQVASAIQEKYLAEDVDRVYVIYNRFKSAGSQEVRVDQLLPIAANTPEAGKYNPGDYIYEPSASGILDEVIPKNLRIQIWLTLLESNAAEQGARMVAMDSATESAREMIYDLTLTYNKARQAAITTEISEIVGGAEALRG